jgi:hypothetical protein
MITPGRQLGGDGGELSSPMPGPSIFRQLPWQQNSYPHWWCRLGEHPHRERPSPSECSGSGGTANGCFGGRIAVYCRFSACNLGFTPGYQEFTDLYLTATPTATPVTPTATLVPGPTTFTTTPGPEGTDTFINSLVPESTNATSPLMIGRRDNNGVGHALRFDIYHPGAPPSQGNASIWVLLAF